MRLLLWTFWLATLLPMVGLLYWIRHALEARWKEEGALSRLGLVLAWILGSLFLLALPHEDSFNANDTVAYRQMSHAFAEGRGLLAQDMVLMKVPSDLRRGFLEYRLLRNVPTRDRVFEVSEGKSAETRPILLPVLPMAAAGQSPLLSPDRFVPLVGSLWFVLLLAAAYSAGGGWSLMIVPALLLGTAWPAWFLRGFHAEAVGAALISGVVAAAAIRPLQGKAISATAALSLGLAVSFHPSLLILAAPLALGLALEQESGRKTGATVAGFLAGLLPAWAITRWVCQPYGDWTRWEGLKALWAAAPEHRVALYALCGFAAVSALALALGTRRRIRDWVENRNDHASPFLWFLVSCVIPLLVVWALPEDPKALLQASALSVWSGVRKPFSIVVIAGAICALRHDRTLRERYTFAVLCWASVGYLYLLGLEPQGGLWNQRHFLPVVLAAVGLMAIPMAASLCESESKFKKALYGLIALGLASTNLVRWPMAYAGINERGAAAWARGINARIGVHRWVVFERFPCSVPYTWSLSRHVLGLSETDRTRWDDARAWLANAADSRDVWLVSSGTPCTLEEGGRLETVLATDKRFPQYDSKAFFPVEQSWHQVQNTFLQMKPLPPGEPALQEKILDGSPFGLRGPWGQTIDGETWSRQGSGVIGPVPDKGGAVWFESEFTWTPFDATSVRQTLLIMPPWGGEPLRLGVFPGKRISKVVLRRPQTDADRSATGIYVLSVERPGLPGARGAEDVDGVLVRSIRIESGGAFSTVTDGSNPQ